MLPSSGTNRHGLTAAVCLVIAGASCGGDPAGPDSAGLVVTTSVSHGSVSPGGSIVVTVRAEPVGTSMVRWITLSISGVVQVRDSQAFVSAGPQELTRTIAVPLQPVSGSLTISGSASAGDVVVSDQETVSVLDDVPPVILHFDALPGPVAPGDHITFAFRVRDTVGVKRLRLRVDNAFRAADSVEFVVAPRETSGTIHVRVPNEAVVGFTAIAWLTAFDESQRSAEAQFSVPIKDFRLPVATMTLGGLRADQTIGTGDTIQITVNATDNHQLTYIGYEGAGLRDSVLASGLAALRTYRLPVPPAWRQQRPTFHVWARDISGNRSTLTQGTEKVLPVYDWVDRPSITLPFSNEPFPQDVTWDAKRHVAYLLRSDPHADGRNSRIEVIHVPAGALGSPIAVGGRPEGFSLTASGDSLVVTLGDARALGIVDLTAAAPVSAIVPLQHSVNRMVRAGRRAGSHLFVPLLSRDTANRLLDVNLATGAQTLRTDVGDSGHLWSDFILFPFPDGRLLLNREGERYAPGESFVYSAPANGFSPTVALRPTWHWQFSASPSGRFMLGSIVYDATMSEVSTIATQDWSENHLLPAALSVDGASAYLATWYGYEKVRISDGLVMEQVKLGTSLHILLVLPDGNTLLAIGPLPGSITGEHAVMLIDIR